MKSVKSPKSGPLPRKRKLSGGSDSDTDTKSYNSKYKGKNNHWYIKILDSSIIYLSTFFILAGGSGIHRPLKSRKQEKRKSIPGEEYRAKKAFGDVKLKGQPDPFAYIPLRRSALNRR